jgi:predicted ATPase
MKFLMTSAYGTREKNVFCLTSDNWDDFSYRTTFNANYRDNKGIVYQIGYVKIGQIGMEDNKRKPDLQNTFEKLSEAFFSVGQNDDYYENIKNLGDEIRADILMSLRDMAFNLEILEKCIYEEVTRVSLLRGLSENTVKQQFNRIANGGARLTSYNFGYSFPSKITCQNATYCVENPASLFFRVKPESNPPTNIHVIIGQNGVGKTFLINNIINAAMGVSDPENSGYFYSLDNEQEIPACDLFANIICVSFSAFDDLPSRSIYATETCKLPCVFIGLDRSINRQEKSSFDNAVDSRMVALANEFSNSLKKCLTSISKNDLWHKAITILGNDEFFLESGISKIENADYSESFDKAVNQKFLSLSSGHKIILLTVTRLIEYVEEKSLIIFDEPETHLHPPLLSSFIRALSDILIQKNGVAIVATHSPVILQEVPASCVWKMQRSGTVVSLERLRQETFGTNINALIREVFGLEVEKSGFNKLLSDALQKTDYNFSSIIDSFNNELGDEAKALVRMLIAQNSGGNQ